MSICMNKEDNCLFKCWCIKQFKGNKGCCIADALHLENRNRLQLCRVKILCWLSPTSLVIITVYLYNFSQHQDTLSILSLSAQLTYLQYTYNNNFVILRKLMSVQ